jgi:hypothetical protein
MDAVAMAGHPPATDGKYLGDLSSVRGSTPLRSQVTVSVDMAD